MIFKPLPPFNGVTGLIISCTRHGVVGIFFLVPISTNTKLEGLYLKSRKKIDKIAAQVDNSVH